jgi:DHA1 family tetracycline resistance protein-like MFS transporter
MVGFGVVAPILPLYARRFGASPATVGLLMASFSLAQLALSPLLGRLSDRVGRRPVLMASLLGTAGASLLVGLAPALWLLFLARGLDGASGASVSVAQAAALDLADPGQEARLLGLLGAAFGAGFVAGPALGAAASLAGPRAPFFLAAAVAAANWAAAWRRLPETRGARAPERQRDRGRLEGRAGLAGVVGVGFLSMAAFAAFEATFALLGHDRLGFGPGSVGVAFCLVGLTIVACQAWLVGPVVARLGQAGCWQAGLALNAAGLALLAGVRSVPALVPTLGLLTVGQGLAVPAGAAVLAGRAGPGRRGELLGFQQASGALARVLGPALAGAAFEAWGAGSPYLIGAGVSAAALVLALVVAASGPRGQVGSLARPLAGGEEAGVS